MSTMGEKAQRRYHYSEMPPAVILVGWLWYCCRDPKRWLG